MRYFFSAPTCSLAAMIALEATQAPYDAVEVGPSFGQDALREISPAGKVPVLDTDGQIITDTIAIVYWLSQTYPEADLLPLGAGAMTQALSRMAWLGTVVHILRRQYTRPMMFSPDGEAQASIRKTAAPRYWAELERIDSWFADGPVPFGVEAYALLFYHWARLDGLPIEQLDHFSGAVRVLIHRADVVRALERHASPLLVS